MPNSVSVVIPYSDAYTRREKLNEAIASVESQAPTTEVIVRTDDGVATARNGGIGEASNRYIAFLDADDVWRADKLERQLTQIQETGAGLCLSQSENRSGHVYDPVRETEAEFIKDVLLFEVFGMTSTILIDSDKVTAKFDESLYRREDHWFVLEAVHEAGICWVPEVLVRREGRGLSADEDAAAKLDAHRQLYMSAVEAYPYLNQYRSEYWHRIYKKTHLEFRDRLSLVDRVSYLARALYHRPQWGIGLIKSTVTP